MMCQNNRRISLPLYLILCALAGVVVGCQTTTNSNSHIPHDTLRPGDLPGDMKSAETGQEVSPDQLTAKDRCPARLHQIEGALLLYYAVHKQMPGKLEDLRQVAEGPLDFTCPDTGLPYAYVPQGLRKPGGTKCIIVHDAVVNPHDGTRWCIVVPDGKPGAAHTTEVVQMPEPIFLAYQ
jgi:hypothetical protein